MKKFEPDMVYVGKTGAMCIQTSTRGMPYFTADFDIQGHGPMQYVNCLGRSPDITTHAISGLFSVASGRAFSVRETFGLLTSGAMKFEGFECKDIVIRTKGHVTRGLKRPFTSFKFLDPAIMHVQLPQAGGKDGIHASVWTQHYTLPDGSVITVSQCPSCGRPAWLNAQVTLCLDCQRGTVGCQTGRTSSSAPNISNAPRAERKTYTDECPCGIHPSACEYHR